MRPGQPEPYTIEPNEISNLDGMAFETLCPGSRRAGSSRRRRPPGWRGLRAIRGERRAAFPHEASSERENCAVTIFRAVPIVVPAEDGNRTWSVSPGKGIGKPFGVFSG
jgi:hypothetical protein